MFPLSPIHISHSIPQVVSYSQIPNSREEPSLSQMQTSIVLHVESPNRKYRHHLTD